jgi:hypothetical protein
MKGMERKWSGNKRSRTTRGNVFEPKPRRAEGKEDTGKAWDAMTAMLCLIFYRT